MAKIHLIMVVSCILNSTTFFGRISFNLVEIRTMAGFFVRQFGWNSTGLETYRPFGALVAQWLALLTSDLEGPGSNPG
jgi:hypothetical protein